MISPNSAVASVLLVAALLACAATGDDVPLCDKVNCAMGSCHELKIPYVPLSTYECVCDPGWKKVVNGIGILPCMVPDCTYDSSCFNITPPLQLPKNISITDPCVIINCGPEGNCVKEQDYHFHCECNPGAVNLLNVTFLPCVKHCAFGKDCAALGLDPPPPPPPTPASAPASSGSVKNLLQLLVLVSLAVVQNIV